MKHDAQLLLRLPKPLLASLDRYAAKLAKETGLDVSRAEAARQILRAALSK